MNEPVDEYLNKIDAERRKREDLEVFFDKQEELTSEEFHDWFVEWRHAHKE